MDYPERDRRDMEIGESRLFYPHYCCACHSTYITGRPFVERCPFCESDRVVNWRGETMKKDDESAQKPDS